MKLHRFFVSKDLGDAHEVVVADSDLYHQIRNVFRFTVGGQVILLDNTGYEYLALVSGFGFGDVSFSIASKRVSKNIPAKELHLFCSLVKKDKFEWIVEKGTELGVSRFIPILSDRSEKKDLNFDRLARIATEAAEQSERATLPVIENVATFESVLKREIPKIAFDPRGDAFVIEHVHFHALVGIFVGPEGGWTEREIFHFKKHGTPRFSLGHGILKTETAALAAASLILL